VHERVATSVAQVVVLPSVAVIVAIQLVTGLPVVGVAASAQVKVAVEDVVTTETAVGVAAFAVVEVAQAIDEPVAV
jgi:hypothetical protein